MKITLVKLFVELVAIFRKVIPSPKQNKNYPEVEVTAKASSFRPYKSRSVLPYADVKWKVLYPENPTWTDEPVNPDNIEIGIPPICPKCETELNERKNIFGKYVWSCISCEFKTKSPKNFELVKYDIKKIAKRNFI